MSNAILLGPKSKPHASLALQVLTWCSTYIRQPDGPDAGGQWKFTPEQVKFVQQFYGIDERGRWHFTRAVLRRAKGWGKTPLVAALALAELCGPVRFERWATERVRIPIGRSGQDMWIEEGEPIGKEVAAAWVQLAGVSEKATQITMSMVLAMLGESDMVDDYGLDIGLTRIYTGNGGKLEPITASAPTSEGARPTFAVEDESHHWTKERHGDQLDRVIRRNLGKSRDGSARMLETTNAHAVGEDSVAERSYLAYLAMSEGRSRGNVLYDSREAPATTDMADEDSLHAGLVAAYGDSTWVDLERIRDEVWDPSTPPEDSRRFYLNQIAAATDSWISDPEWAGRAAVDKVIADRDPITLGFDGSRSRARGTTDATALIGCRVADGHLFELGVWEEPEGLAGKEWRVPTANVDAAVRSAFNRYNVVGFFADPARWESYVAEWEASYGTKLKVRATQTHPIEWWMVGGRTRQVVAALDAFHSAVIDGDLTHDGAFVLARHVLNARRRPTPAGVTIAKEHPESARKIDAAVAAVLAYSARLDALAAGVGAARADVFVPRRVR